MSCVLEIDQAPIRCRTPY